MTAKLNRVVRCAAALTAVIAVGAGATACNSSSDDASSKTGAQSEAKKDGGKEAGGVAMNKMAQKGSRTDAVNTASARSSNRCHTGELNFTWAQDGSTDMKSDEQQSVMLTVTNDGSRSCTLYGFPGVQLISEDGDTWDLNRSADEPSKHVLKPGDSDSTASVSMVVLPVDKHSTAPDQKPFVVDRVTITPPDEKDSVTLDWPYGGAVLDQSMATRPGTFVNSMLG